MTTRNVFLLELLAGAAVTVPIAVLLRPAVQASTWPPTVMAAVVVTLALGLAMLIDFTAMLLRRGPRRAVRA